ncbi:MAG: carbohydrate ABC transporter permease [Clostridia bacterium]|nr:carbohydrate ABC transporter permease [Clostridia bacterium]
MRKKEKSGVTLNRSTAGTAAMAIFIVCYAAVMVLPLILMISNSLKPLNELWIFPPKLLPTNPTLKNFKDMFIVMSNSTIPFTRYLMNTVVITVAGTVGNVIISSLCAYPLSKMKFKGRSIVFKTIVLALMFNGSVTAIPSYLVMTKLHLVDNLLAIILPAVSTPVGLYLMKQFMDSSIPDALLEAASIDGASQIQLFTTIVMPNVKPAWMTLILLSVQGLWNTGSSTLIFSENNKSFAYAIQQIGSAGISRAGVAAAASVVMMSVPVIVFVISQSQVLQTMATSGMKD